MKKSLKLLVLPAAMILLAGNITSCAPSQKLIAMISDVGDIDDGSFNQGCWEAVKKYGQEKNISYDYYRPFADSEFARKCAVKQAVIKGAKIIIMPGFKFTSTSVDVANEYPDVHFVLIDSGIPVKDSQERPITIPKNLVCVTYDFQYSGWLAGYSIATDYFATDLENIGDLRPTYGFGFMGGMSNGGVFPYGFGYIQGILYAAQEFTQSFKASIKTIPQININYSYAGVFMQDDSACAAVKGWYANQDIKCVFACGGKLYQSVTEAMKYYNNSVLDPKYRNFEDQHAPRDAARWVGVDGDQYSLVQDPEERKTIYTSALKDVGKTCQVTLDYHFDEDKTAWDKMRSKMEEGGARSFKMGIQDSFDLSQSKSYDNLYDYVGIVDEKKPGKEVLRGYNKMTFAHIIERRDKLGKEIKVYEGFSGTDDDKHGEFGENSGDPSSVFKLDSYYLSDKYNIYGTDPNNYRYPKNKFVINVM